VSEYGFPWFEFISLLLAGAGMLGGVWYRLHTQITANREFASVQVAAVHMIIAEFKLQVAREYATNNAIREVEQRVVDAINRLGDRFENFFENQNRNRQ